MRYRVLVPMIGPGAFFDTCRVMQVRALYRGDEFEGIGTADELDRLLTEGMIERLPDGESAAA